MKSSTVIILIAVIAIGCLILYSLSGGQTAEEYATTILKEREEKNLFMKSDKGSPFKMDTTIKFRELQYFAPDSKYKISADLTFIKDKKVIVLPTSDGLEKKYLEYAYAEFNLEGKENKLLILEVMDTGPYRGTLFFAFADETSAGETYGAGRYLELKKVPAATSIILDFNKAYNPYCAYSGSFSCPFPPKENVLEIAIKAGEKSFHQ